MAAIYKQELGRLIKEKREALGLTQHQLAEKIPVNAATTVSRWERGERAPNDLEAVARALGTTGQQMLAELGKISQRDRNRLVQTGETQLDRIEAAMRENAKSGIEALADLERRLRAIERLIRARKR